MLDVCQQLQAAKQAGLAVRVHADQLADDGGSLLAAELGAVSADHLEYISDQGIEALARAGTCGVLLPGAAFFLMMDVKLAAALQGREDAADLVIHDMPNRYHLVYRFGAPRVRAVVASGKVQKSGARSSWSNL